MIVDTDFTRRYTIVWQDRGLLLEGICFLTLNCIMALTWPMVITPAWLSYNCCADLFLLPAYVDTCFTQGIVSATGDVRPGHASPPQEGPHTALLPQLLTKRGED